MNIIISLVYMAAIFMVSSTPRTGTRWYIPSLFSPTVHNLLHIPAYGLLALSWILTLRSNGFSRQRSMSVAVVIASAYGGFIEFYQAWVPGRFSSIIDFFLNVVGILLFSWLFQKLEPLVFPPSKPKPSSWSDQSKRAV